LKNSEKTRKFNIAVLLNQISEVAIINQAAKTNYQSVNSK